MPENDKQMERDASRERAGSRGNVSGDDPVLPVVRAEGFCKTYGTRVLVMRTEYDLRLLIANEVVKAEQGGEFYLGESMVVLTPVAAKELASDLAKMVREWERDHGKIDDRPRTSRFTELAI